MKKINNCGRSRHFTLVFYGSQNELFSILHTYACRIEHYAFILHDRDVYLDDVFDDKDKTVLIHAKGDLELLHYHVLIDLYNGATFTAIKRIFTTAEDKPRVEPVTDRVASYLYLTHRDNPEKFQYSQSDIISDDINYYEQLVIRGDRRESDNLAEQIVNDILRHVSPMVMLSRYGRDFVIHRKQYEEMADMIRDWNFTHQGDPDLSFPTVSSVSDSTDDPFDN